MTKLIIELDVDNDALQDAYGLSRALEETTRSIVAAATFDGDPDGPVIRAASRSIVDDYGNTVGRWKVVD